VRSNSPARLNSRTEGPYSSDTRKVPVRGLITTPSGSKARPSVLVGFGARPFRPWPLLLKTTVSTILKLLMAPVFWFTSSVKRCMRVS
jgi:hypothetical protein